nr:endoplasmic reticulum metallopeptidase 1 isoform X1 [Ipomoea batatas]
MRQRPKAAAKSNTVTGGNTSSERGFRVKSGVHLVAKRSGISILVFFVLVVYSTWAVYCYQYESLPQPLSAEHAGKRGFSELEAVKHVEALTKLGPHPVRSNSLDSALQYVLQASEAIKKEAHWEVDVEIDLFHSNSGANHLVGGLFKGKTLVYSDLNHIVLRISPKYGNKAEGNAILVSSHIDTVFSTEGAGDCSSCVAVMLELARGICHWAHGFKNSVIFLFNTGEEEGLNGAHSFVTQHPWSDIVRVAIDLEAMGIGGKSGIFQAGPDPWAIENYAQVAKYPSAQIVAQDLFTSGVIKSATDFQVYRELGGLSGLDFAYTENTAIYHTKNDKLSLLKPGSLQHLGENMLAFLLRAAASTNLPGGNATESEGKSSQDTAIYFDFLGTYMIVFRQQFADMLYNSVILQSLLIWIVSLFVGGYSAVVSLAFSCLSIVLMWICSIGFSVLVAFVLPLVSPSPVPFVSCPWLVVGLFAAPALLGAFGGQHVGYRILEKYLSRTFSQTKATLPPAVRHAVAKLDAERWIFKAGLLQWLVLLSVGHFFKIGSSYLALVWLVPPAFAYGLLDATLSPARLPKPLKTLTLLIGLSLPFLTSSGLIIRLVSTVIGTSVRFVRNPGGTPEWLGNVILALFIAAIVCLTLVYLLSYIHISGAKVPLVIATCILFGVSLGMVLLGVIPPFTEDTARAVNVVHVVDATRQQDPVSYISLFSTTPGNLIKEAEQIGEGFICGRDKPFDFVTFSVKYSCWTNKSAEIGWKESDIPALHVESDIKGDSRVTHVLVDTKVSTRWSLGINTDEIEDFQLKDDSEELISLGDKSGTDGWHTIQFSGGKKAPTKFSLTLFWHKNNSRARINEGSEVEPVLLKLRTDVDRQTPKTAEILKKLPPWCSLFGKSTSPYTLAFFKSLPVAL